MQFETLFAIYFEAKNTFFLIRNGLLFDSLLTFLIYLIYFLMIFVKYGERGIRCIRAPLARSSGRL